MASAMTQIPIGGGHVICVCEEHLQEFCHRCGYDFTDMNENAREQYAMEAASEKPMKKGMLPKGTVVRQKDRSGRNRDLIASIVGMKKGDPWGLGDRLPCYILESKDENKERFLVWVEEVHEEYLLEGMSFDKVKEIVLAGNKGGSKRGKQDTRDDDDEDGSDDGEDGRNGTAEIASLLKAMTTVD